MKYPSFIYLIFFFAFSFYPAETFPQNNNAVQIDSLRTYNLSNGVKVYFDEGVSTFPAPKGLRRLDFEVSLIDNSEIQRTLEILELACNKYPDSLIHKTIKEIYVFKSLKINDLSYGGTYHNSTIFLTNNGASSMMIEETFHAEFSSLLLYSDGQCFQFLKWLNLIIVPYGEGGREAIRTGKAYYYASDSSLHKVGFLYQYAQSSLENDVNSFARYLFVNDWSLWELYGKHDLTKYKTDLMIQFYGCLDSQFDKDFFQGIK